MANNRNIAAIVFGAREIEACGGLRPRADAAPVWRERLTFEPEDGFADALARLKSRIGTDRISVALPPDAAIVRLLTLPPAGAEELRAIAELQMTRLAPFPGEEIVVGYEVIERTPEALHVLAVAVPLERLEPIDTACRAVGLSIARVDLGLMGLWEGLRRLAADTPGGRIVWLIEDVDGISLIVGEGALPLMQRRLVDAPDRARLGLELTRSLMHLEIDRGPTPITDVRWIAEAPPDVALREQVAAVCGQPLRETPADALPSPAAGVAQRSIRADALNIFPQAWSVRGEASRVQRRIRAAAAAAAALWLGLVALLWGGPWWAQRSLQDVQRQTDVRQPAYQEVSELRERVRLILRYTDRSRSLLNSMRTAVLHLPEGVTFSALTYRREESLRIGGDAPSPDLVYAFKEAIDAEPIFEGSTLTGPTWDQRRQRHVFELNALWRETLE